MRIGKVLTQTGQFIEDIDREFPVHFAYLFGSQARGTETCFSDIDLAVYFKKDYYENEVIQVRGELIERAKCYFTHPVDIISLRHSNLFLKHAAIKDGILIKDTADSIRAEFESLTLREYFDFQYYSDYYNQVMISSIKEQTYFGDIHG